MSGARARISALGDEAEASLRGLVNNAGAISGSVAEVLDVNVCGIHRTCEAFAPLIDPGGRIVNVVSNSGIFGGRGRAAYGASKAGLINLTQSMAIELAEHDILVNAVAPTFIETEMTRDFLNDPDFRKYALAKNLIKRFGTPDDVAGAVLYLASPVANLVTGHVLLVDAGWTAH